MTPLYNVYIYGCHIEFELCLDISLINMVATFEQFGHATLVNSENVRTYWEEFLSYCSSVLIFHMKYDFSMHNVVQYFTSVTHQVLCHRSNKFKLTHVLTVESPCEHVYANTKILLYSNLVTFRYRPFSVYKTGVLLIFSFITGDKTEFHSPMMFSNEYITGI